MIAVLVLLPGEAPRLDTAWHGHWAGTLHIRSVDGKEQEAPMELIVEPIKDSTTLKWQVVYGEGKTRQVRDYRLVPQEKPNHFVVDEQNGLLLDIFRVGSTLHSQFQVEDSNLVVRYELRKDSVAFTIEVYTTKGSRTTKLDRGKMEATAYVLQAVQSAELKPVKK